ncbi:MAG: two-component system, OmpR family, phosphate regulon response regulator PhoB [Verrucomicrobia bacterium]|jgi:two-component system phosphate regulon response regulator PhoB|nr:MAG: two-component system, OmpR family, phosphate regulon response regulator PhoB [Verrucomicrobiota bacterium]
MHTVLVVDDETDILELVVFNLERQQFKVLTADNGISAVQIAKEKIPDLIVLDLMLPGMDGFSVYRELRADPRTNSIPVLMLTAKGEVNDRIAGLELGADDYVTKPFSPRELLLRVRALLKRTRKVTADASLKSGDFLLERNTLKLFLAGRPVDLTATEFKLLRLLVEASGEVQERDALLREVWGYSDTMLTRTLDTHVKRLREKLGKHAECIQTVRGVGYRFVSSPTPA